MSEKLKSCPFCGSEKASMKQSFDDDGSNAVWKYIECNLCGARTRGKWFTGSDDCPIFYEEVRNEWNRRLT